MARPVHINITAQQLYDRTCYAKKKHSRIPPDIRHKAYKCPYCKKWHLSSHTINRPSNDYNLVNFYKDYPYAIAWQKMYNEFGANLYIRRIDKGYELRIR